MKPDTDLPKMEQAAFPTSPGSAEEDELRSLTRLLIGGVDIGIDELRDRLRKWEQEVDSTQPKGKTGGNQLPPGGIANQNEEPDSDQILRYALIGMLFEAQGMVKSGFGSLGKMGRLVYRWTNPIIQPLASSRLLSPAKRRYERLVSRGQQELDRWITIGRQEETRSRTLVQTALTGSVNDTIDYMAGKPEIQQLIQAQTTGLAEEVVEEVRERTMVADILLEGFARSLFRRQPRYKLPPPPPEVLQGAVSLKSGRPTGKVASKG